MSAAGSPADHDAAACSPGGSSAERNGQAVVLGLGRSGRGAARLLHHLGWPVSVLESGAGPALEQQAELLRRQGIPVRLGTPLSPEAVQSLAAEAGPSPLERVIVSPGIRWDHPALESLRQAGLAVEGELSPAWQASTAVPWIGITGTNGKTTVTHLVSHLLSDGGLDAPMAGNVGLSAAERVLERCSGTGNPPDWLVVEVSSYQIEAAPQLAPRLGIWTTLTPDHLERHGTLERYRAIKRSLLERSAVRVLNGDDPDLRSHAQSWDQALWISAKGPGELSPGIRPSLWIEAGRVWHRNDATTPPRDLLAADALAMPGRHNQQNMLMAVAAGLQAGLDGPTMEAALRRFPGVPHRLERLRCIDGVTFYNDSKATNYDASEVGLRALEGPLVVLAGGQAKIGDASGWLQALADQARGVVLYGQAGEIFAGLLQEAAYGGRISRCEGLDEAVPLAARWAEELQCRGVLLSPACASFDQYSDFEARGDHFRRLVEAL